MEENKGVESAGGRGQNGKGKMEVENGKAGRGGKKGKGSRARGSKVQS